MLEGCTHNTQHEDIGRVKIPALMKRATGASLTYEFFSSYDLPDEFSGYAMAIQCGSCMLTRAAVQNRTKLFETLGLPVTNYGIALAYFAGILKRATEIFH